MSLSMSIFPISTSHQLSDLPGGRQREVFWKTNIRRALVQNFESWPINVKFTDHTEPLTEVWGHKLSWF